MFRGYRRSVVVAALIAILPISAPGASSAEADTTPPSAPTGLTTSVSGSSVALAWNASTDDVGVTSYAVHTSQTSGFTADSTTLLDVATATSYDDRFVPQGTWYYRIIARDAATNHSAPSEQASAVVTQPSDVTSPSAPAGLVATISGDDVALSWSASTDDVGVVGYEIHASSYAGFVPDEDTLYDEAETTTYDDTDSVEGVWYYRVIAFDGFGNLSAPSNLVRAVVDVTPPSVVTGLAAMVSGTSVTLSWNASSDNIGVTSYGVYRSSVSKFVPDSTTRVWTSTTTSTTVSNFRGGVWYYRVIAEDEAGNRGTPSDEVTVIVNQVPATPWRLTASSRDSAALLSWSWRDIGYPAGHFVVTIQPGGRQLSTTATGLLVDGLSNGTSYTFSVRAENSVGSSAEVTSAAFVPADTVAPRAVTGLKVTVVGNEAVVTWINPTNADFAGVTLRKFDGTAPTDPGPAAGVEIYRGNGTTATVSLSPGTAAMFIAYSYDEVPNYGAAATAYATTFLGERSRSTVTYGGGVTHKAKLPLVRPHFELADTRITLYKRVPGAATWSTACAGFTSSTGEFSCVTKPTRHTEYEWRFAGFLNVHGSTSARYVVRVRPKVSATASSSAIRRGSAVTITGSVAPRHAGKKVYLQRYSAGRWRIVGSAYLSSTSRYSFRVTPRSTSSYRVYKAKDGDHSWGVSRTRRVAVR